VRHNARSGPSPTVWLLLSLALLAVLSRVYTTNSLAGEPTSDEYLYAIHARDIARGWAGDRAVSGGGLASEGRSVAVEAAGLSFLVPWDVLTLGRTVQALLNALCVPAVLLLGRQAGLPVGAAVCAALLLLAAPEFQESAWRFWTDSQATLLTLAYLSLLLAWLRRPSLPAGMATLACLTLLVLTKESTAVTLAPFAVLVALAPLARRWRSSPMARLGLGVSALAVVAGGALLVRGVPPDLARVPLLQRTFGSAPLILASILDAAPKLGDYPDVLAAQLSSTNLSVGFLWAATLACGGLVVQALAALVTGRCAGWWSAGWVLAAVVWLPTMLVFRAALASAGQPEAWPALAAALLLAMVGTLWETHVCRKLRPTPWGLLLLGVVVLSFFAERLVISVTPKVANAALTFRSFMPIVPLLALLAGRGVWAAASAAALVTRGRRSPQAATALAATLFLVVAWSPLVRERTTPTPLLGRSSDRGADSDTPLGLRVVALVDAEDWLKANLEPTDVTITGMPRHLAWYADLGVEGMDRLVDLGSQPRTNEERRAYIMPRMGPSGAAYLVDFNVDWTDPGGDRARQWQQTYQWLASQPGLEMAYVRRDTFGNVVFYVIRNHGYARPYS